MSRGQGRVYRDPKTDNWMFDYSIGGKRRRVSSGIRSFGGTRNRGQANEVMQKLIGDRKEGRIVARPEKVFLAEYTKGEDGKLTLAGGLRYLHETQLEIDKKRRPERQRQCWNHIEAFFPAPTPVTVVTPTRLDDYAKARLADGAARQTVNNELSALRRGFNLAIEKELLARAPKIKLPKVENAREGFFEMGNLAAVLLELPAYCRVVIQFLEATGWRVDEALSLTWDRIDWEHQGIRLSAKVAKGKAPRLFPFGLAPDLKAILDAAWQARNGAFVFQGPRAGKALGYTTLLHHWQGATTRAGCEERIIHDLRRTAVQSFVDAGVDEQTIMDLCGMKTRSIFGRYLIVRQDRLERAVAARLGNGRVTAESTLPQASPSR